jgi:hypothetical protein
MGDQPPLLNPGLKDNTANRNLDMLAPTPTWEIIFVLELIVNEVFDV